MDNPLSEDERLRAAPLYRQYEQMMVPVRQQRQELLERIEAVLRREKTDAARAKLTDLLT
ncbi:MAG: hypothetical protein HY461_01215 [Parcubacteria group bacterium]|nr:hypothetical protein [Parcubacteria group bacterium]